MLKQITIELLIVSFFIISCTKSNKHGKVITLAGGGQMGKNDGQGDRATFANPIGITIDKDGNLIIADALNNLIRKVSNNGIVSTIAGNGEQGKNDGLALASSFFYPASLTTDINGNIFIADTHNNLIRKINSKGNVTTLLGINEKYEDYGGKFPLLDYPSGIAVDKIGNIYIADSFHNKIRKLAPNGSLSIIAGNGAAGNEDGIGNSATFYIPEGLAFDSKGNLYVADTFNNMIRKISADGKVITLAGQKKKGLINGPGKTAAFLHPTSLAIDKNDNIYVTDTGNQVIRKISSDGMVSTFAGNHKRGFINGDLKSSSFFKPMGIAIDHDGCLYITDFENNSIRKIIL